MSEAFVDDVDLFCGDPREVGEDRGLGVLGDRDDRTRTFEGRTEDDSMGKTFAPVDEWVTCRGFG